MNAADMMRPPSARRIAPTRRHSPLGAAGWIVTRAVVLAVATSVTAVASFTAAEGDAPADAEVCDLARKADIMHGAAWQRAITALADWLDTQTVYPPAEVRRIKVRFNEQVAAMSSYELDYLLDSMSRKMDLLATPEARDAKAWLGEYLSAMSSARRAQELRSIPNLLDMTADELWQEIQRIDRQRAALQQRQQGTTARQQALVGRADANRRSSADAARAAAERSRTAPAVAPGRQGTNPPPFSDVPQRRPAIGVGPMGAFISM